MTIHAPKTNPDQAMIDAFIAENGVSRVPMTKGRNGITRDLTLRSGNHIRNRRRNTDKLVEQRLRAHDAA